MRWVVGLGVAILAVPMAASAQMSEAQKREACTGDVMRLCSAYIPDRGMIAQCLSAQRAQISPACRVAIGGGNAAPAKRDTRRPRRNEG